MATTRSIRKILVTGSSGYVGNSIIKCIAKVPNVQVYGVSRTGLPRKNSGTELLENVEFHSGDCLKPETIKDLVSEMDGVVHTVGTLVENKNDPNLTYQAMNRDAAVNVAKILNDSVTQIAEAGDSTRAQQKKHMAVISSSRAPPFMDGYLTYKWEADEYILNECPNLNATILRPGFITSASERWWGDPLRLGVELAHMFDPLCPKALQKFNLIPERSIKLDTVAHFAKVGVTDRINHDIYGHIFTNATMLKWQHGEIVDLAHDIFDHTGYKINEAKLEAERAAREEQKQAKKQ